MENLKGMRKGAKRKRETNRRLHSLPFRKLQSYVEYKALSAGMPIHYVNPKGTSSKCPICGGRMKASNGRWMRCRRCGCENDRDVIACFNLLRRSPRCGEHPLTPKAIHEAFEAKMERIVIKC